MKANAVISYALWGDDPKWVEGLEANVALAREFYPGWEVSVCCSPGWLDKPLPDGCWKVRCQTDGWGLLFSRMFVSAGDRTWLIRDLDSRITKREADAVAEWLDGPMAYHSMHDHEAHFWPLMGGMWGGRKPIQGLFRAMVEWPAKGGYMDDQRFLAKRVFPAIQDEVCHHSSIPLPWSWLPFQTPVADGEQHVGART